MPFIDVPQFFKEAVKQKFSQKEVINFWAVKKSDQNVPTGISYISLLPAPFPFPVVLV